MTRRIRWRRISCFSFTTDEVLICGDPATLISAVQGNGLVSPLSGMVTIEGVVVGDYQATGQLGGFHVQEQDADADANPATSEGIFVFIAASVALATSVRVKRHRSAEFGNAGVTLTELGNVSGVNVCGTAIASPPPRQPASYQPGRLGAV